MSLRHGHLGKKATVAWLVTLARAGYGVALIGVPGLLIGLTGERGRGRGLAGWRGCWGCGIWCRLGITAASQLSDPGGSVVLGGGAAVDLLHATSMIALGAWTPMRGALRSATPQWRRRWP